MQLAIADLPPSGGEIDLPASTISCAAPLVIDKPGVTLKGVGPRTLFRLADHVNLPVIVVGSSDPVPSTTLSGVTVRDIAIDGNAANQDSECLQPDCPAGSLRANGLTIRASQEVLIDNVSIQNARSGGLVAELDERSLNSCTFASGNVLMGYALPEAAQSPAVHG